MISPCNRNSPALRRHDMISVSPAAWRTLLETRDDLAAEPLIVGWIDRGWPLVARRATPCETSGVALGLPLPPFAGKRRFAVLVRPEDVISTAPPPPLRVAIGSAPPNWRPVLEAVARLASRHGVEARIFGSLAWQSLTGLQYLTGRSDLDLLLPMPRHGDPIALTAGLAAIEATAPMRLDGELLRDDGAAVNWRELHDGAREILVKTTDGVALFDTSVFLSSEMRP